ncbi:MAG: proline dehydrogenase family protein [Candidatus Marinimicrobia bacterium]|nr:proline dehydrogenase family protein [Candidatus Neomarinimicrobiota bacterium]
MAKWLNNVLVKTVPFAPKFVVGLVAKKYVSGETVDDALRVINDLNRQSFNTTVDILGEHIQYLDETELYVNMYAELISRINPIKNSNTISLKLSMLGIELDRDKAWQNFETILKPAKQNRLSLCIDMEDSSLTDITLEFFKKGKSLYQDVTTVLQAYLFRSHDDLESILPLRPNVRICKGIYKESPKIAYQDPDRIREKFFSLVKILLKSDGFAAIATHDLELISVCEEYIKTNNIPAERYEFQALYGVPIQNTLKRLVEDGHTVRIYVPYGKDWYPYSMRRLKENPDIAGYIFKDFFRIKSR